MDWIGNVVKTNFSLKGTFKLPRDILYLKLPHHKWIERVSMVFKYLRN